MAEAGFKPGPSASREPPGDHGDAQDGRNSWLMMGRCVCGGFCEELEALQCAWGSTHKLWLPFLISIFFSCIAPFSYCPRHAGPFSIHRLTIWTHQWCRIRLQICKIAGPQLQPPKIGFLSFLFSWLCLAPRPRSRQPHGGVAGGTSLLLICVDLKKCMWKSGPSLALTSIPLVLRIHQNHNSFLQLR